MKQIIPKSSAMGDGRCLARARINGQATEMPTKRKTNSVVCELNGKAGKGRRLEVTLTMLAHSGSDQR